MAVHDHQVVLSPKIYLAEFDLSSDMNAHGIAQTVDLPDDTCYGDTFKQRLTGLRDISFSLAGNWDAFDALEDQDTLLTSKMAVNNVPLIITPNSPAVGDACEFGLVAQAQYSPQAQHGQILKWSASGNLASRRWLRGNVLWAPSTVITGTASGSQVLISAASASQSLYVAIAVWAATSLTSMVVKVQSDTTGFASPTDKVTFTTATGVTSEMPSPVSGANTDTYYRATVSSFTGTSAQMIVVAAIA
jgi:hypothetical protein